jgi:outer membrane protein assembly factor BamB
MRAAVWLMLALACAGCAAGRAGRSGAADGWPAFHGSAVRHGVVRAGFTPSALRIAWTYEPQGPTNGFMDWGPVASDGTVYTPNGLNRVVALDAGTGAVRWDAPMESNVFSVALSPDRRQLLVTTAITARPSPTLFALDPMTGAVRWHNQANGQAAIGGIESAPVADGITVYAGSLRYDGQGGVTAYDLARGSLRWQWLKPGASAVTPLSLSGGRIYAGLDDRRLYCLDARTGRVLWDVELSGGRGVAAPVVDGPRVYVAWEREVAALDARTGSVLWRRTLAASTDMSSPALHDGVLYAGTKDGTLVALRVRDGAEVWSRQLGAGALSTSPVVDAAAGRLWIVSAGCAVLQLSLEQGAETARFELPQRDARGCWRHSPVVYRGHVLVGSLDGRLHALSGAGD